MSPPGNKAVNGSNRYTQSLSRDSGIVVQGSNHEEPGYDKKLTVIEFLKQEYDRIPKSSIGPHGGSPSKRPLGKMMSVEGKLKEKSLFQHRAASDTNLISSIDRVSSPPDSMQSHDSESAYSSHKTRVSSSFSYPELSKYSDHDRPKLVTQIGHSTLRYNSMACDHQYLVLSSFKLLHANFSDVYGVICSISLNKLAFQYMHILSARTFSCNV